MGIFNENSKLAALAVEEGLFREKPFRLLDVGCSGGIDPAWSQFDKELQAWGLDPQQSEIDRLNAAENREGVEYYSYFVGEEDSPYGVKQSGVHRKSYFNPFDRLSMTVANELTQLKSQSEGRRVQSQAINEDHTNKWISVPQFVREQNIDYLDFVKIDTDGNDYEVLRSLEGLFREKCILGVQIEANFYGSHEKNQNTFSNIDRFMRENGFHLFDLDVNRYSRLALPAPFKYDIFAQTLFGQPMQGECVYLRDGGSPEYSSAWSEPLDVVQVLKLATLMTMFRVPDCAAETLLAHRALVEKVANFDSFMDSLIQDGGTREISYAEYMETFKGNPGLFLRTAHKELDLGDWLDMRSENLKPPSFFELQFARHDLKAARERIEALENSTSWKLTAPIRKLMNLFRGKE